MTGASESLIIHLGRHVEAGMPTLIDPTSDVYFIDRVGASVPRPFAEAVHLAVRLRGVTLADYVRSALADALARDGIPHQRPPRLGRTSYLHNPIRDAG